MTKNVQVSRCTCEICRLGVEHPEQVLHHHINLLMSQLNEQQRRWLAALLAEQYRLEMRGIYLVAQITGISEKTIRKGVKDLKNGLEDAPEIRVRRSGSGRPRKIKKQKCLPHKYQGIVQ